MATTRVDYNSYNTVFTTDAGTRITVATTTNEKRVTTISVGVIPSDSDTSTYSEAKKKEVHTAVATAISGKIGDGI